MTTNKKRRSRRHDKTKKRDKKNKSRRHRHRHRSHKSHDVSSWKNHYTYESDNLNPTSISNGSNNKNSLNNGIIVNGLRDFLALKKDKK